MSDNLMVETQNLDKEVQIKMLKNIVQRLESENKSLKEQIINQPQIILKSTHSIIQQIPIQDISILDCSNDDYNDLMKKTENRFCSQCRSIYQSVNRNLQYSVEETKQKLNDKILILSKQNTQLLNHNQELNCIITNKEQTIESQKQEIQSNEQIIKCYQDQLESTTVNLDACKKFINKNKGK